MVKSPPSRLLQVLQRIGRGSAPPEGSDAVLLTRFVESRDEAAFEELLRRHGGMVLRVCRRHLGGGPDADDAFQAVFLVLARDAARIGRRESLAGWLFRVAYHVSRKLMGQNTRRRTMPVRDEDCPRESTAELDAAEVRAIVEEELRALPDRLRSPVVLCYLEGRSNSEAAALLGCPKGTIDSRLAAARKRLHGRLLGRGVALAATASLESLWSADGAAAAPALARRTLSAAMQLARTGSAAGAVTQQVLSLVAGVSCTMSTNRLPLLLVAALLVVTLGGTGVTIIRAQDRDKPAAPIEADKPKPRAEKPPPATAGKTELRTEASNDSVQAMLRQPLGLNEPPGEMAFKDLLTLLQDRFKVSIRIDLAEFSRLKVPGGVQLYERRVGLPVVRGMSFADALNDALAQLAYNDEALTRLLAFRVRNGQIVIVPAYLPSVQSVGSGPGGGDGGGNLTADQTLEQDEGEPISLSVEEKPFAEVLRELRQSTGANIVLDAREKEKARETISATLHDVRLMAALRVLGDMCDLQPVALNNVFYVTSKENAEKLQKEIDRRRYGDPAAGLQQNPFGLGGFGGLGPTGVPPGTVVGGGGIGLTGRAPASPAAPPPGADTPSKTRDKDKPPRM